MSKYSEYVQDKQREYGEKFDDSHLPKEFVEHFNSGQRVKVRFHTGEELTGTIGVTTGWRPVFLLMRRSNASGSSDTLRESDHVIAVQRGRTYVSL